MIKSFCSTLSRVACALAASLAALPAAANVDIQHWVAANGTRVYFVESHVLPILDVQVDFDAGAARDPADKSGLASMTQSLLDSGAGGLDEETLAERLTDLGAQMSGVSDNDRAGLSLRTLSSVREREGALELLRTVLTRPEFPGSRAGAREGASDFRSARSRHQARCDRCQAFCEGRCTAIIRTAAARPWNRCRRSDVRIWLRTTGRTTFRRARSCPSSAM
jgi:hypothetical protein